MASILSQSIRVQRFCRFLWYRPHWFKPLIGIYVVVVGMPYVALKSLILHDLSDVASFPVDLFFFIGSGIWLVAMTIFTWCTVYGNPPTDNAED
jgi:hypothetical protein